MMDKICIKNKFEKSKQKKFKMKTTDEENNHFEMSGCCYADDTDR